MTAGCIHDVVCEVPCHVGVVWGVDVEFAQEFEEFFDVCTVVSQVARENACADAFFAWVGAGCVDCLVGVTHIGFDGEAFFVDDVCDVVKQCVIHAFVHGASFGNLVEGFNAKVEVADVGGFVFARLVDSEDVCWIVAVWQVHVAPHDEGFLAVDHEGFGDCRAVGFWQVFGVAVVVCVVGFDECVVIDVGVGAEVEDAGVALFAVVSEDFDGYGFVELDFMDFSERPWM